ncbi:hypothetical protein GCM10022255_112410 [Dactylosporangium darangshiense]|uniref:Uncharacterized protein n=1 Tax=Dactylosporangium darangshiense TaxID=579108 RepID=A0ABP8DVJ5_9ACTN
MTPVGHASRQFGESESSRRPHGREDHPALKRWDELADYSLQYTDFYKLELMRRLTTVGEEEPDAELGSVHTGSTVMGTAYVQPGPAPAIDR